MGSLKLQFRPKARADLREASAFYAEKDEDGRLVHRFLGSIERTLLKISENPQSYFVFHRDVRRAKLNRFPYSIYFRVQGDVIEVFGVMHSKRDPDFLRHRLEF
jgi:plasmid stabilization system protein ParE